MRTTLDIRADQVSALARIQARRKEASLSNAIEEAADEFVDRSSDSALRRHAEVTIAAMDSFSDEDVDSLAAHVARMRASWHVPRRWRHPY